VAAVLAGIRGDVEKRVLYNFVGRFNLVAAVWTANHQIEFLKIYHL
jgi:hypothetical protein